MMAEDWFIVCVCAVLFIVWLDDLAQRMRR